jgi:hypothetical protein
LVATIPRSQRRDRGHPVTYYLFVEKENRVAAQSRELPPENDA